MVIIYDISQPNRTVRGEGRTPSGRKRPDKHYCKITYITTKSKEPQEKEARCSKKSYHNEDLEKECPKLVNYKGPTSIFCKGYGRALSQYNFIHADYRMDAAERKKKGTVKHRKPKQAPEPPAIEAPPVEAGKKKHKRKIKVRVRKNQ